MVAPVAMPANYFSAASFDLKRYTSRNDLYGGLTQVREQGEARWQAQWRTGPLTTAERGKWRAWWDTLKGGIQPFLGYDPASAIPSAYFDTGVMPGGFNGVCAATGLTANQVTLFNLPAGFILSAGDMFELVQGDNHSLHRITVANPPGSTIIVAFEPRCITTLYPSPTANVKNPGCNMIAIPDSWSFTAEAGGYPTATFSAIQKVI